METVVRNIWQLLVRYENPLYSTALQSCGRGGAVKRSILILAILFISFSGYAQTSLKEPNYYDTAVYVAKLRDGIDSFNATMNNIVLFTVKKGQLFVYTHDTKNIYLADGRSGYIPEEKVQKANAPYFKFNFSKIKFDKMDWEELYLVAVEHKINFAELAAQIKKGDSKSMMAFWKIDKYVDGAAAEEFSSALWMFINFWNDKHLSGFISQLPKGDRKKFCYELTDYSIPDPDLYFAQYYPITYRIIKANR